MLIINKIAFSVNFPKLDRISDAEEQIKIGADYMNKGSLDMVMESYTLFIPWIIIEVNIIGYE